MRNYTKIEAWRLADDLAVEVYRASSAFPKHELYGLTSQLRRAAASAAANIAEGAGRGTRKDYLHFLHIARGSLAEAHYFVHLAHRLEYLEDPANSALESQFKRSFACLHALIRAVETDSASD